MVDKLINQGLCKSLYQECFLCQKRKIEIFILMVKNFVLNLFELSKVKQKKNIESVLLICVFVYVCSLYLVIIIVL